jgi:hypothetical protein
MLELRPIVVNAEMMVLGGNMRLKACKEAGLTEVPILKAEDLTENQQREFIIKDNVGYGEWDWEQLANEWDSEQLGEWGLVVPHFEPEVDYSILDDDLSDKINELSAGVKKAIQIEFEPQDYDEAYDLVKFWRERGAYVGAIIVEHLRSEKSKI